jgi:hypothetical protein
MKIYPPPLRDGSHPWRFIVRWREPGSGVIPHPGHAMHRTRDYALAHIAYLKSRGIPAVIEERT